MFSHRQKNQAARYLLNNWIRYEKNINEIHVDEIKNMKMLFAGLQKISQDKRLYLASQYRTARGKKYMDAEIAAIQGVDVATHKEKWIACETALQDALIAIDGGNT